MNNCLIIQLLKMASSSEKLLAMQEILATSSTIKQLLDLISGVVSLYPDFDAKQFSSTEQFKQVLEELQRIQMPDISQIMSDLREPNFIIALPIKVQPKYTLFFVVVPAGQKFDWHSHPNMVGVSKCLHGQLRISAIDVPSLKSCPHNIHVCPINRVRYENIKGSDIDKISTIVPDSYNIHRIQAIETSAFFDLLMPDYPDNSCQFYRTIKEEGEQLCLKEIHDPLENIKGWDAALREMKSHEKHQKRTYILQ